MRCLSSLFLFACAGFSQVGVSGPDDVAERIRTIEQLVKENPADAAVRESLLRMYREAIYDRSYGVGEMEARDRMVQLVREIIRLDPGRRTAGTLSRLGTTWRDPVYARIRALWLEAAAKHAGNPDVQVAAASALAPAVDHQEILRLTEGVNQRQAELLRAEALANALVYGDPVQSADAQTKLSLLSEVDSLRAAAGAVGQILAAVQNDPARKSEEIERYRTLANELAQKAGPAVVAGLAQPPRRITVGGNVQEFMLIRRVDPVYPPDAAEARISGRVKFTAIIGRDGKIQHLQLMGGHPLLVSAATDAVRQWEYKPTLLNGQPVEVVTQIDVLMEPPR